MAWGFITGCAIITSNYTMATVAINRYMLIAHAQPYRRVFRLSSSVMMACSLWLLSLILLAITLTGWGGVTFNDKTDFCSYERNGSHHYFLLCLGFVVPLSVVCFSYALLYRVVRRSRKRIASNATSGGDQPTGYGIKKVPANSTTSRKKSEKSDRKQKEAKLTIMLFIIFVVYVGLMGPYFVVNMIDTNGQKYSENIHKLVTWIAFSTNAVNPIIYAFANKQFRDGYATILVCRQSPAQIGTMRGESSLTAAHAPPKIPEIELQSISDDVFKK